MRKILLSVLMVLGISLVHSQNVQIIDTTTMTVVNGQEITVTGSPQASDIPKYLWVKYTGFGTVTLQLKRIELDVTPATLNSTCWGLCPADVTAGSKPVWDYADDFIPPVDISSGDSTDQLQTHFRPNGIEGCSTFRYSLYDVNNPNDSVYVDIRYIHTNNGLCNLSLEEQANLNKVNMYPNPANGSVNFNIENNHDITSLVVVDMLGKTVKTINTTKFNGLMKVDVSSLNDGVYFIKVMQGSRVTQSKKLMVK